MIEVGVESGDSWPELWGRLWSVDALLQLGRLSEAEAHLVDLEPVVERLRWPVARWHLLHSHAAILQARARFDEALQTADYARAALSGTGLERAALTYAAFLESQSDLVGELPGWDERLRSMLDWSASKDAVTHLAACFVDLDLPEGETHESALAQLHEADRPAPSFIVSSGYSLHVVWLLAALADDKTAWKAVQRGLVRCWADLGADRKVAPDESRVLRLVPYANRKRWPDGVPTEILEMTDHRYTVDELTEAFGSTEGTPFSRNEILASTPRPRGKPSSVSSPPTPYFSNS